MNFIRIGNQFVNLKSVRAFELNQVRDNEISVTAVFDDNRMTIHMPTFSDRLDTPTITVKAVASAIQDAIANCADADCEDFATYVEDYLDEDDDE